MGGIVMIALRAFQWIFIIIIMGLIGNMIDEVFNGNPSVVNYAMFTAVFGLLSLIYLTLSSFTDRFIIHPLLLVSVEVLNTLFFFVAGVALAAKLGVHDCSNESYVTRNEVTDGSTDPEKRCREAQASTAFLWFTFALFAVTTFMSFLTARSVGGTGGSVVSGSMRRRGPGLAKV